MKYGLIGIVKSPLKTRIREISSGGHHLRSAVAFAGLDAGLRTRLPPSTSAKWIRISSGLICARAPHPQQSWDSATSSMSRTLATGIYSLLANQPCSSAVRRGSTRGRPLPNHFPCQPNELVQPQTQSLDWMLPPSRFLDRLPYRLVLLALRLSIMSINT